MYPVDKSIAMQILAVYKTWKLDPREQDDAEKPNIVTTLYEVDGDVPIIVQKIRAESDDEKYRIKFSKEGGCES